MALRMPAFLASRHLTFDDGNFGASAVALRHGEAPFSDVFSSQGPLFLPLVWLADLVGLHTLSAPRLLSLAGAVLLVVVAYRAGCLLADRRAGLVAGGLVTISGSSLAVTGPLSADGPAMALAAAAVLLAFRYDRSPSSGAAVATGVVFGAALTIKALVLPAAVPIALILFRSRRTRDIGLAVGGAVVVGLGWSLAWGWADVWDQSVTYHLDAPGSSSRLDNLVKVLNTLATRDLPLLGGAAVAAWFSIRGRRRGDGTDGRDRFVSVLLWSWLVTMVGLLVFEHPLWRPHVAELTVPVVLLIAYYRPPWRPVVVVVALLLPLHLLFASEILWPEPYRGAEALVVDRLRELPPGAQAISDEAGQVWRAGRRTPGSMVDSSVLRIDSGRLTAELVATAAAESGVCAVVVWTERFAGFDDLGDRLTAVGYEVEERYEDEQVLYVRTPC